MLARPPPGDNGRTNWAFTAFIAGRSYGPFHTCGLGIPLVVSSKGFLLINLFFVVGVPLAIVEPLKLVALFIVGDGHFIAGVVVMICAYGGSLFVTERLFIILKPKLLTLPWFAKSWSWFVPIRKKLLQWFRRKWIAGAQILSGRKAMKLTPGSRSGLGKAGYLWRLRTDREPLLDQ